MPILAAWSMIKTFGPWALGAIAAVGLWLLVVDRNRLAKLNDQHTACVAAVEQKPNAKPLAQVCDPPISAAAEAALAASACDTALSTNDQFAASKACPTSVKTVIAQRDASAGEAANLKSQLDQAQSAQTAAVARAEARAQAASQGLTHAQALLAAQPHDADGLSVCDADCLRGLAASVAPAAQPHP